MSRQPAPLCEGVFEFGNAAILLYDNDALRGCVCQKCLADKPFRIASKVRLRAERLHSIANQPSETTPDTRQMMTLGAMKARADQWEILADKLAKMKEWPRTRSSNSS
jgi:hypothetical protein